MNWQRIRTGTLLAAIVIAVSDYLVNRLNSNGVPFSTLSLCMLITDSLLLGFFCAAFYAVARPRLGPGPKTAVIVGASIYLIKYGIGIFFYLMMHQRLSSVALSVGIALLQFIAATYVAGWQYIEKAP
jgi:hypothetical protein